MMNPTPTTIKPWRIMFSSDILPRNNPSTNNTRNTRIKDAITAVVKTKTAAWTRKKGAKGMMAANAGDKPSTKEIISTFL